MIVEKTIRRSAAVACFLAILISPFKMTFSEETGLYPIKRKDLIEVKIYNLVSVTHETPVVLLSDSDEKMVLPIWISPFEANAMYSELAGIKPFRPQTHDLLKMIIQKFKATLRHIVITHEKENVYYAKIIMDRDGRTIEVDARPSDSIVMALKFDVPILIAKNLFAEKAISVGDDTDSIRKYGLTLQDLSSELAHYFSLESMSGVLVSDVRKGSNAEKDGLKIKDIIVEIDKEPVKDIETIKNVFSIGAAKIKVKIFRNNDFIFLPLHLKGS